MVTSTAALDAATIFIECPKKSAQVNLRVVRGRQTETMQVDLDTTPASLRERTLALVISEALWAWRPAAATGAAQPSSDDPTNSVEVSVAEPRPIVEDRFTLSAAGLVWTFVERSSVFGAELGIGWTRPTSAAPSLALTLEAAGGQTSASLPGRVSFGLAGASLMPGLRLQFGSTAVATTIALVAAAGLAWSQGSTDLPGVSTRSDTAPWGRLGARFGVDIRITDSFYLTVAAAGGYVLGGLRARVNDALAVSLTGAYVRATLGAALWL